MLEETLYIHQNMNDILVKYASNLLASEHAPHATMTWITKIIWDPTCTCEALSYVSTAYDRCTQVECEG